MPSNNNKFTQAREITQEERIELENIENSINESQMENSSYIKFEDGQKMILYFQPRCRVVYKKYDSTSKTFEESDSEKEGFKKHYRFFVIDPNNADTEKTWDVTSIRLAKKLITDYLKKNKFLLKIKRIGADKETVYDIEEAGDN